MNTKLGTILLAAAISASGCATAAMAGAGAAGAMHVSGNSASSMVPGSLADVDAKTQAVLREMGITIEDREVEDAEIEYSGTVNDLEINVELEAAAGGTTRVTASARKNAVEWDNDYAQSIVQRISSR